MDEDGYALFDTPIGRCAIAWSAIGVVALQLPEADDEATRERLLRNLPDRASESAPPPPIESAVEAVDALLHGKPAALERIALDMRGASAFEQRVYRAARTIAPGSTLTYRELAERIGAPGAARAVGGALGRNRFAIIVPCHRVVAAGGRSGGFSAHGGAATKLRLLVLERALA